MMTSGEELWLANACKEPFGFLVRDCGFSGPVQSRAGNEFTVRYQKGRKTVSICVEPFSRPIVELFYPTTNLANRRFPRQTPLPTKKRQGSPEEELNLALLHAASELAANEREWLYNPA